MEFCLNFFPDAWPDRKPGDQYFREALDLVEMGEELGYDSVKIVEHYFRPYGGYSPNPIVFLAAASQRTRRMRFITGCVLPVFNHPLKLAGEIGMIDCISGGRFELGIARAFLPHEFDAFGVPLDESRARFEEGVDILIRLLSQENVVHEGRFHRWSWPVTSLPRPVQKPHPPIWIATVATRESFEWVGRRGYRLMVVPYLAPYKELAENIHLYREMYRAAGHPPENERVLMVLHMYAAESPREAREGARPHMMQYIQTFLHAVREWADRRSSSYNPAYAKIPEILEAMTYERILEERRALIGTPDEIVEQMRYLESVFGRIDVPAMQVNFGMMPFEKARRSIELFAKYAMPKLR
jgi:alkanesulfonate monooxygenase SsuD/methylene tetrahydromethanopterin reductase-like flavin-dependent oxidoreductase (luciferase family)